MSALLQRYRGLKFRVVDYVTLGYVGTLGLLVLLFARRVPEWRSIFILHLFLVVAALEIVRANERLPKNRLLSIVRTIYPLFIIAYGFFEIAKVQYMFSGDNWATDYLVAADLAIFGGHPTVLARALSGPGLDEVMGFFRIAYFVVPVIMVIALLATGRDQALLAGGAGVALVYVANYALFLLFPAVNPRMVPDIYALHGPAPTGYFFAAIETALQGDHGAVAGAAFPSAHTSGTIAWTLVAFRYFRRRWPGIVLAVISAGTALATVFLGYHHATDPIGGIILALAVWPLAMHLVERRGECPLLPAAPKTPVGGISPESA